MVEETYLQNSIGSTHTLPSTMRPVTQTSSSPPGMLLSAGAPSFRGLLHQLEQEHERELLVQRASYETEIASLRAELAAVRSAAVESPSNSAGAINTGCTQAAVTVWKPTSEASRPAAVSPPRVPPASQPASQPTSTCQTPRLWGAVPTGSAVAPVATGATSSAPSLPVQATWSQPMGSGVVDMHSPTNVVDHAPEQLLVSSTATPRHQIPASIGQPLRNARSPVPPARSAATAVVSTSPSMGGSLTTMRPVNVTTTPPPRTRQQMMLPSTGVVTMPARSSYRPSDMSPRRQKLDAGVTYAHTAQPQWSFPQQAAASFQPGPMQPVATPQTSFLPPAQEEEPEANVIEPPTISTPPGPPKVPEQQSKAIDASKAMERSSARRSPSYNPPQKKDRVIGE